MDKRRWLVIASVVCSMCFALGGLKFMYSPKRSSFMASKNNSRQNSPIKELNEEARTFKSDTDKSIWNSKSESQILKLPDPESGTFLMEPPKMEKKFRMDLKCYGTVLE